jgi:hypothetical protein
VAALEAEAEFFKDFVLVALTAGRARDRDKLVSALVHPRYVAGEGGLLSRKELIRAQFVFAQFVAEREILLHERHAGSLAEAA